MSKLFTLVFLSFISSLTNASAYDYSHNQKSYQEMEKLGDGSRKITVATFNMGFLNTTYFGVKKVRVPEYEARLQGLPEVFGAYLNQQNSPDVIALQEVWNDDAANAVRQLAKENGYISATSILEQNQDHYKHNNIGLDLLIKEKFAEEMTVKFSPLKSRHYLEVAVWVERGVLSASLKNISTTVMTTHLTPTIDWISVREKQIEELSQFINSSISTDYIFLAADFNISPEFSYTFKDRKKDGTIQEWNNNSDLYRIFQKKTQMIDSFQIANPKLKGYTQDRVHNDIANFSHSTTYEPEQRLDFVWLKAKKGKGCLIKNSKLLFNKPIPNSVSTESEFDNAQIFLSDHFGVESSFNCHP